MLDLSITIEVHANKNNNNILNKLCIASLKSKINKNNMKNFNEVSHYACDCFFKKYKSGSSIRISRNYCRDKAIQKYNL